MSFFTNSSLSAIPQLAIVLGIMVLVHEFGHFAMAKLCGVRVEAFAIGFGKRLFGFVHNGTDYRVNLLPLGGYVKMAGEYNGAPIENPTGDPGEFTSHPRWQRVLIALAGPVANFILAFLLIVGLYMAHHEVQAFYTQPATADYISPGSQIAKTGMVAGDRIVHFDDRENPSFQDLEIGGHLNLNQTVPFSYVHDGHRVDTRLFVENKGGDESFEFEKLGITPIEQAGSVGVEAVKDQTTPAARAGFRPGDFVQSVDNQHPHSVDALVAYLQDQAGKPASVVLLRKNADGSEQTIPVVVNPMNTDIQRGKTIMKAWILGFTPMQVPVEIERLPLGRAAEASYTDNLKNSRLIFDVLHRLFTRQVSVKALQSPIGIGVQVHQAFQEQGWGAIVQLMAAISLNLGIFNLLPIPILDGGMILFLAIESIMRRDLNQQVKERVYQVAFVCLILFAAMVIFNDLTRLVGPHIKT